MTLRLLDIARPLAGHLVGAAIVGVALLPWLQVAAPRDAAIAVFGAALVATLASVICGRILATRLSTELGVSAALLVIFLLLAVVRDPTGLLDVVRGLRDGVPRILSTTLPILDVRWAAVPAAAVAWATGGLVTLLLARTRTVAAPIVVAICAFVAGYAVTLGGAGADPFLTGMGPAAALAVLAWCLAALRADRVRVRDTWQRSAGHAVAAAAIVVVSLGVAALAVDHVPYLAEDPVEPRLAPQATDREPTSPTLAMRRLRGDEPERVVARVDVGRPWSGYVAIAALSDYDGRVWGIGRDRFDPTGGLLPVELPVGDGAVASFDQVDVDALGGWLPFVARAGAVEGASILHNGGGAFQLAEGEALAAYRLQLAQPSHVLTDDELPDDGEVVTGVSTPISVPTSMSDRRPAGERVCRFLALSRDPGGEPAIDGVACGSRAPATVGFLRALSDELRSGRAVQQDLVGGDQLESGSEALYDLLDLVGSAPGEGAVGTPEQFASAYALIAHDYGIPVRVVTGFRLEEPPAGEPVELSGAAAWTWVEVPVDGVGWVVVDPSPSEQDAVEQEELEELRGTEPPPQQVEEERSVIGVDPSRSVGAPPPIEDGSSTWWWLLVLPPLLPFALLGATLARRGLRRRRRRQGSPREQVVGAWHEVLDRVHDAGVELEALSADEVADAIVGVAPWLADPLAELVAAANRAVFSSRPMTEDDATSAWDLAATVRRDLRRTASRRRRFRALFAPPPTEITATTRVEPLTVPSAAGGAPGLGSTTLGGSPVHLAGTQRSSRR